ncbi:MAG: hypothetical protein ACOYYS_22460 [Chloroflexota bacterium]
MVHIRLAVLRFACFLGLATVASLNGAARAHPLPAAAPVAIEAPESNAALQGIVSITGSAAADGMRSWSLEFAYAGDTTGTWFIIAEGEQPVVSATLAEWDTTTLTDGDYALRLTAWQDGTSTEARLAVRVRNYTPIETPTMPPTAAQAVATASGLQPAATPAPSLVAATLTPFPTNPAELTSQDVVSGIKTGALLVVIVFLLTGAYVYLRHVSRQ